LAVHLSLVIPAYNEASRIGATLHLVEPYLAAQSYTSEIIVVDDGSEDDTVELVKSLYPSVQVIQYQPNRGKGYAVRTGMEAASGAYKVFYDADGSTPIEELEKLWPRFDDGADIVIGSRSLPDSDVQVRQHVIRESMGRIFNRFVKFLMGLKFIDTQCGFKGFTRASADLVFARQTCMRFSFDAEILYIALKHGLRVDETPVCWYNSPDSRVNIIMDSARMIVDLVKVRIADLRGKYA